MPEENEIQEKFRVYKSALKARYGVDIYDSWFKPLSLLKLQNGHAVIGAPSNFSASKITERYSRGMFELWHKEIGPICQISIRGMKDLQRYAEKVAHIHEEYREDAGPGLRKTAVKQTLAGSVARKPSGPGRTEQANEERALGDTLASPLNAELTFDRFCLGEANRVAFMGARSIVEGADDPMLFIYGASGRGKTHLLNAIGHEWLARRPQENVLYLTHDNLLNGYVSAVLSKSVPELRAYLDRIDALLIDDIHLLRGRKATQEELLNLIDRLIAYGKTVVIAGAMAPYKLAETGLNQRLADRLSGGVCASIDSPDYQLRMKIVRQMAEQDVARNSKFVCDDKTLQMIARSCDASIRELEGAYRLIRLSTRANWRHGEESALQEDKVRALLDKHVSSRRPVVTLDDLIAASAKEFDLSVQDLQSRKRMQPIAKGRHAFCLLARRLTDAPLKQIGSVIDRDHTTVLSSIERGEVLAEKDPIFGDRISRLMEEYDQ